MKKWLTQTLFDWVFVLLYSLFQAMLNLVKFIESFFDVFAGTAKIFYKGNTNFLINIFFGHDAVTNAFWAMALIAIVMAFGFCIVQVSRKAMDTTGSVKQSVGQIVSGFIRCLLIILLLNVVTVSVINMTNVLLDRINYALENAAVLHQEEKEKTFTDQEYAMMARILATVANYSVNPTSDSRYNINSCFNAVRPDLLSLYVNGFFSYDYPTDVNGHCTWQGALALLASSADLTEDLSLDVYYADVANAVQTVSREISTYREFAPVERATFAVSESIDTDILIFLIAGMESAQNKQYNTGEFNDALRKGYISGEKSYNDQKQVRKDFDIWTMNYLVGYIACVVFIIIMAICIFTFIVRMFNLLLLYLTAPLFASSMPMDDGAKWQSWTQAFIIQLFSGFGLIIAMRLYLIIIPVVISSDLVFFAGEGIFYAILNRFAQLLMILGGAWAVLQSGSVITGILAGNPGMAAIQQEGQIGRSVTGWAMAAPKAALGAARMAGLTALKTARMVSGGAVGIASAPGKAYDALRAADAKKQEHNNWKNDRLARRASVQQNKSAKLYDQSYRRAQMGDQKGAEKLWKEAGRARQAALSTREKLAQRRIAYGLSPYQSKYLPGQQQRPAAPGGKASPQPAARQMRGDGGRPATPSSASRTAHSGGTAAGGGAPPVSSTAQAVHSESGRAAVPGGSGSPPPAPPTPMARAARSESTSDRASRSGGGTPPPPPPPPPRSR